LERGEVDSLIAIGGFGDDMELAFAFEQDAEAASNEGMIVGDHDAGGRRHVYRSRIAFGIGIARGFGSDCKHRCGATVARRRTEIFASLRIITAFIS
jgi:hypothetical protein